MTVSSVKDSVPNQPLSLAALSDAAQTTTLGGMALSGSRYTVGLAGPTGTSCVPGSKATYTFTVRTAGATGGDVMDLQQYLGAAMHLAAVSGGLGAFK